MAIFFPEVLVNPRCASRVWVGRGQHPHWAERTRDLLVVDWTGVMVGIGRSSTCLREKRDHLSSKMPSSGPIVKTK